MLKVRTINLIGAHELMERLCSLYGIPYNDAQYRVFDDPTSDSRAYGTALRTGDPHLDFQGLCDRSKGRFQWNTSVLLSDLCNRGEIPPGEYEISF